MYVYLCTKCMSGARPWRSEDSIRSHNTVVTNSCEPPVDAENELRSPQSSQRFLTTELPLQPLPSFYFISAQSHHYSPFYIIFLCTHILPTCVSMHYMHIVPTEARRGYQIVVRLGTGNQTQVFWKTSH